MKVQSLYLIDDDEDDVLLFCEALAQIPIQIELTPFTDCRAAYKQLEEGNIPDMIFLDLNMPHGGGKEFLGKLRAIKDFNAPVIIYSISNFKRDIEESLALGASDYMVKPGDFSQLCSSLKNVLGEKAVATA